MIQIKPNIQHQSSCPYCNTLLKSKGILWQGIHICVQLCCFKCKVDIIEDLKVGHAIFTPYQVDLEKKIIFGDKESEGWFGRPLLQSLLNPQEDKFIEMKVEKFKESKDVVILNCIDFLYGHSLLKLLNAESHLTKDKELGLIVIIPSFLRWMVPNGVSEVWTVNIPLSKGQNYYPKLDELIKHECKRFDTIYVSLAHSLPKNYNITNFTRIQKHDFRKKDFRITFIWREDRLWIGNDFIFRIARKFKLIGLLLKWQNFKIKKLFKLLHNKFPQANFTVAGLGTSTSFPQWIEDKRVSEYTDDLERVTCKIYSESRLVIGVHGSNMLLPSAHAGMTIDLMPVNRWGNFAQDILYQEKDNRVASFRYRFLPINTKVQLISKIAFFQLKGYQNFINQVMN